MTHVGEEPLHQGSAKGRSGTPLAVSDTLVHTRVHSDPRFGYAGGRGTEDHAHLWSH